MSRAKPVQINASNDGLLCRKEADSFIRDNLGRCVGLMQTCQRYAVNRQKLSDPRLFYKLRDLEESVRDLEDEMMRRMRRRK